MFFFFFQAEDGIRDLVRSRGLGDVYKRQLGADPAEGNPNSDDSAAVVLDAETWAEVASVVGLSLIHI